MQGTRAANCLGINFCTRMFVHLARSPLEWRKAGARGELRNNFPMLSVKNKQLTRTPLHNEAVALWALSRV